MSGHHAQQLSNNQNSDICSVYKTENLLDSHLDHKDQYHTLNQAHLYCLTQNETQHLVLATSDPPSSTSALDFVPHCMRLWQDFNCYQGRSCVMPAVAVTVVGNYEAHEPCNRNGSPSLSEP